MNGRAIASQPVMAPMVGPRDVNYWGFDDVYWKGARVLHTLRSVINNDDIFFKWIKEIQKNFRHSVICSDELIEFTNETTDINLDYFFKQYIFDRKRRFLNITKMTEPSIINGPMFMISL